MQVATERSREVMSYCKEEGKDRIIFVTKEDHQEPSKAPASLFGEDLDDDEPGLINEDGSINWTCPCLGGMASGPCGPEFREAFSCFHYSTEEPKGAECFEQFRAMQECMAEYPSLYETGKDDEEESEVLPVEEESDSERKEDSRSGDDASKDKTSSKDSTKEKS